MEFRFNQNNVCSLKSFGRCCQCFRAFAFTTARGWTPELKGSQLSLSRVEAPESEFESVSESDLDPGMLWSKSLRYKQALPYETLISDADADTDAYFSAPSTRTNFYDCFFYLFRMIFLLLDYCRRPNVEALSRKWITLWLWFYVGIHLLSLKKHVSSVLFEIQLAFFFLGVQIAYCFEVLRGI